LGISGKRISAERKPETIPGEKTSSKLQINETPRHKKRTGGPGGRDPKNEGSLGIPISGLTGGGGKGRQEGKNSKGRNLHKPPE